MLQTMKKGRSATALPDMIDPRAMFEMAISRPISHDISGNDLEVFHEQYSNSKASSCISGNPNQIQQSKESVITLLPRPPTPSFGNSISRLKATGFTLLQWLILRWILPDTSFINCLILRGFRSSSSRSYYQRSPLVHFRSSRIMHSIELEGDLAAAPAHCRPAAVVVFLL
jgi:hypothetical protein